MHAARVISSNLIHAAQVQNHNWILLLLYVPMCWYLLTWEYLSVHMQKDMKKREPMMVAKSQIGSRPPKCERRCSTCEHCEAVQVPVVPQIQTHRSHYSSARATTIVVSYSSRGDDLSNYKPMSWKCKCGNYLFNPWSKGGTCIHICFGIKN